MKKLIDTTLAVSADYREFIEEIKARVLSARLSAARRINHELIFLYWDIGRGIIEKQRTLGWGESVVELVALDLQRAFPSMSGFSPRNVWYMRRLYEAYSTPEFLALVGREIGRREANSILPQPVGELAGGTKRRQLVAKLATRDDPTPILQQPAAELTEAETWPQVVAKLGPAAPPVQFLQQLVAEVPWGHHIMIIEKLTDPAVRLWYLRATANFGWTRNVLLNQIKAGAYERAVVERKTHNFDFVLPEHLAEQADEMLKSSYNLEFLGLRRAVRERELETRLISRLQEFILELGYGFCFVGRQYRVVLGENEYYIDLLFYHRFLRALVAFDLKIGPFVPEYAGKMDFYLNVLNDTERAPDDQPSIGIILCAEKDDIEVEYALRSKSNPIGVAAYELQSKLPGELKGKLPTAKQLAGIVRAEMEEGR